MYYICSSLLCYITYIFQGVKKIVFFFGITPFVLLSGVQHLVTGSVPSKGHLCTLFTSEGLL